MPREDVKHEVKAWLERAFGVAPADAPAPEKTPAGPVQAEVKAALEDLFGVDWQALRESIPAAAALEPLVEAFRAGRTAEVVIIEEGPGARGRYYPASTLRAAAPKFVGAKMFIDHATPQELAQRPERSVRDLAGVLESVRFVEHGPNGKPALVGRARLVNPAFIELVEVAGPFIGVSIDAVGRVARGPDGTGSVTEITEVRSVDFVTMGAAGGRVLSV